MKPEGEDRARDPAKFERELAVSQLVIGEDEAAVGGYVAGKSFLRLADSRTCGKMAALEGLLRLWSGGGAGGSSGGGEDGDAGEGGGAGSSNGTRGSGGGVNKVLIFSSSVKLLNIMRAMVDLKGYDCLTLDGSTPMEVRWERGRAAGGWQGSRELMHAAPACALPPQDCLGLPPPRIDS